jgi:hypothetical protein
MDTYVSISAVSSCQLTGLIEGQVEAFALQTPAKRMRSRGRPARIGAPGPDRSRTMPKRLLLQSIAPFFQTNLASVSHHRRHRWLSRWLLIPF